MKLEEICPKCSDPDYIRIYSTLSCLKCGHKKSLNGC